MAEVRIVLGSDEAFTKAKLALLTLWNNRKTDELHTLEIKPYKRKRTVSQNSRYWAILTEIAQQLKPNDQEYSPETWHEYFKAKMIGKDTILIDGEAEVIAKSSANLEVQEFTDYMTQVEAWAIEHGVQFSR